MSDKKEKILQVALELFANNGYDATATSKIAKGAGVSEGLIFRHFKNKKGLLDAIMHEAEHKLSQVFAPVIFETDPTKVLCRIISLPYEIEEVDFDFWKLQYKLKWQKAYQNPHKMQPIIDKLSWAFQSLGFPDPASEAALLVVLMDGIALGIMRDGRDHYQKYLDFLLKKYTGE
ncbi:MAG: TetR/AcrR family transcriptional regulator [Bacteroidota bacterium]